MTVYLFIGKRDFHGIWSKASSLSGRWDSLGLMLYLSPDTIDEIYKAHHDDPRTCLRKVLTRWLEMDYCFKRYGHPSWRMLCIAIKSTSGGNDAALAEELARKHLASADHSEAEARSPFATCTSSEGKTKV